MGGSFSSPSPASSSPASPPELSGEDKTTIHLGTEEETLNQGLICWFQTAIEEDAPKVSQLLATRNGKTNLEDWESWAILRRAVANEHAEVAAHLLAACPSLFEHVNACRQAVLHDAARAGNHKVVTHLLSTSPKLGGAMDTSGWTALHRASIFGHDRAVASLLRANPGLVSSVDSKGRTALHMAAANGHRNVMAQLLLIADAEVVKAVDHHGQTALHLAFTSGFYYESLATILLDAHPGLAHAIDNKGNTALHLAVACGCSEELVTKLADLSPASLRVDSEDHCTPLQAAIACDDQRIIQLFQRKQTMDDTVQDFVAASKSSYYDRERLRPLLEGQCQELMELLHQDVIQIVFEYLGFLFKRPSTRMTEIETLAMGML